MQRILNLTHNDLDGIASAVAITTAHPVDHVKVEFVTYDNVHSALKKACDARIPWDRIILSDISVKVPGAGRYASSEQEELAKNLPEIIRNYVDNGGEFVVLDHHPTAIPMKFHYHSVLHQDSILQVSDDDGTLRAGSELAARYMIKKIEEMEQIPYSAEIVTVEDGDDEEDTELGIAGYDIYQYSERVFEFCTIAGDLDVWRDPFGFGGRLSLALDLMDDCHGALDAFISLIHLATAQEADLEETMQKESPLLDYYYNMANDKLNGTLALADKSKTELHSKLHTFESKFFLSHCSQHIYDQTKGVVLVTYETDPRRISFRRHDSCGVDLGKFCAKYGGGGHSVAAAMTIPEGATLQDIIEDMKQELDRLLD